MKITQWPGRVNVFRHYPNDGSVDCSGSATNIYRRIQTLGHLPSKQVSVLILLLLRQLYYYSATPTAADTDATTITIVVVVK